MDDIDLGALFDGVYFAAQDAAKTAERLNAAGLISDELVKLAHDQIKQAHALVYCARAEAERAAAPPRRRAVRYRFTI
jgi:hypothetical protein